MKTFIRLAITTSQLGQNIQMADYQIFFFNYNTNSIRISNIFLLTEVKVNQLTKVNKQ